ncbi:MAG: transporter substrate-binding domain-containing protein [Methanothrix sp.]|nr:transporter substrate-binding domain-containing protein [Methanothrix sp.]
MLQGKKVAVPNASISYDLLKNQTGVQELTYDSEGEGLQALLQGKADAFVDESSTTWFRIMQQNISGIRALAMPWEMHSLYFGVRDPLLLQSLDLGLNKLILDGRYDRLNRECTEGDGLQGNIRGRRQHPGSGQLPSGWKGHCTYWR